MEKGALSLFFHTRCKENIDIIAEIYCEMKSINKTIDK